MTSSCICIEKNLRNEFRTEASFDLFGMHFRNIDVKIDTGCGYTSIPAQRVGFSKAEAYALKLSDAGQANRYPY